MIVKKAYHPKGKHAVLFREDNHTYIDNFGVNYTSGTTFIKKFHSEFDSVGISEKCSKNKKNKKYFGRLPEDIRKEWAKEAKRGSSEGDNCHFYAECLVSDMDRPQPISNRCKNIFKQVDIIGNILLKKYILIGAEFIVFSPYLKIAGMIDLLMYDADSNTVYILDWKQNKEITTSNTFRNFFPPIDHLQESDKNTYTLQLSLYEFILKLEGYFPKDAKYKRGLIHLSENWYKRIELEYYDYEIKEMLKHG